jgi:hypothetical protein
MQNTIDEKFSKYFKFERASNSNSYEIVDDLVNVNGGIMLNGNSSTGRSGITKLPIAFGKVFGNFNISYSKLKSLKGCPTEVRGSFFCDHSNLTSLEYCPKIVSGNFYCMDNPLTSIKDAPDEVKFFACSWNKDLPILSIFRYSTGMLNQNKPHISIACPPEAREFNEIIEKYLQMPKSEETILKCQQELIESGFAGNAAW